MRRAWLVAKYETRVHLGRRSFWLTTFALPAAVVVLALLVQAFSGGGQEAAPGVDAHAGAIGIVDESGLVGPLPPDLPPGLVHQYQQEDEAQAALGRAEIERYYVIAEDYVASGRLTVVQPRYQPLRAVQTSGLIEYVINMGITGDPAAARLLGHPIPHLTSSALAPVDSGTTGSAAAAQLLPYVLMFILYLALAMTAGFMLTSVSKEKENRTAEMLLVSLNPRHLMMGKIIGLSAVGLIQVAVWLAVFFGVLGWSGTTLGIDVHLGGQVAARVIPWTVGYFLFGYLLYASLYATLGVLAPTARDANQFVFVAILPLLVPILLNQTIGTTPDGSLAVVLSLFPLTSPIAMVARLGAGAVPWWQASVGLVLLAVSAYFLVLRAAGLFRAENVLSSRPLNWARLRDELLPAGRGLAREGGGGAEDGGLGDRGSTAGAGARDAAGGESPAEAAGTGGAASAAAAEGTGREASAAAGGRGDQAPAQRGVGAGWGGWGRFGKGAKPPTKNQVYLSVLTGVLLIGLGLFEISRGSDMGIAIAALGVFAPANTYWRYRRRS